MSIRPYTSPEKFTHISESQDYDHLIDAHALGGTVHINRIGGVHPRSAKANRRRIELFYQYTKQLKQWPDRYSMPFYIHNAIGDFWYPVITPSASFNYLIRLRNAGANGVIYSGRTPEITLNDGRRSITALRHLGIPISTTNAGSESEDGNRYTLHTDVRDRLPKDANELELFPLVAGIAIVYFWAEAQRAEAAHIQYLQRLSSLCCEMGETSCEV